MSFTIRVYGLLIHNGFMLVSDELIRGHRITKFPGGGLEFGEGTKDCLIREIRSGSWVRHFNAFNLPPSRKYWSMLAARMSSNTCGRKLSRAIQPSASLTSSNHSL
jgi:hypothetical protein